MNDTNKTYDEAMKRLEEIARLLENENTPIETSLELFKEGIALTKYCQEKLTEIENQIYIISKEGGLVDND